MRDLPEPLPHVQGLHAYTPGLQPTESGWVKLNTNECPYPPSPRVAEAIRRELGEDGASLRLYPDPTSSALRAAIAAHHGLKPENVCVGNGSDDLLNLLVRTYCDPDAKGGYTVPGYSLYPVLLAMQRSATESIEFGRDMRLPVDRIAESDARLFLLTSPNAPTGVGFPNVELEGILKAASGLVVADEAYAPFADQDAVPLLARHRNLAVLRTFSKSHALAGLRVGYLLADPEVIALVDRFRDSYNVNRLSQAAALAALGDEAYYADVVARVRVTRDAAYRRLVDGRGWFTYPSQTNFLFTEPRNAAGKTGPDIARAALEYLQAKRVLVRHFASHVLTAPFLRITVGTPAEMAVLDQALDSWQKE
jgi:histidinol-phosphate aminotransferase